MKLSQCLDRLEWVIRWAVIGLLAIMVGAIGSQVVARYVFNQALYWTEELGRHLMIWMVFLASVLCMRRGYHLSITLLAQRLRPRAGALLRLAVAVVMAVFLFLMVVYGWSLAQRTMVQRSSALHYPMGYVYAALPVSGLLMLVVNLELLVASGLAAFGKQSAAQADSTSARE